MTDPAFDRASEQLDAARTKTGRALDRFRAMSAPPADSPAPIRTGSPPIMRAPTPRARAGE